jgi:nucleoside-diphosphate-sugar epimerase
MKFALIFGSSGFIGGHLVKTLIDEGYYVIGTDIRYISYDYFTPNEFKQGDLREIDFVNSLFNLGYYYDEIYQLAADMGGATYINSGNYDGSVMSNSVTINSNIAKCLSKYKFGNFFFASSACVYSNLNNIAHCNEEDVYPAFPDNEYGWEKLFSERMYKSFERQYGLNIYIARFHSVIGEYSVYESDRAKAHSALAYKVALCEENGTIEVIGDGTQIRTFLYIKDLINGIRSLVNSNCKEIVNIGSDEHISINGYLDLLKKISGKKFNIKYIDGATGVKERYCNISKINKICGWKPEFNLEKSTETTYSFILKQLNINKPVIGFVTQKIGWSNKDNNSYCGIGIRGKLTSDILTKYVSKYNFIPAFINSNLELEEFILNNNPLMIIYNYHHITTPYLCDNAIREKYSNIKHVMIHYDLLQEHIDNNVDFYGFKYIISDNDKLNTNNILNKFFIVSRSIPYSSNIFPTFNTDSIIPIIGFQGFGFKHKGIDKIAFKIQEEFDEAIFKLHIPCSFYADPNGEKRNEIINEVKSIITKPGIKIEVSTDFLSDEEIIKWLNQNTINCYFYDYLPNSGIASSPDYAIAAYKPIAINNSRMFLHLHDLEPSIEIEKNTLKQIIQNSIKPLMPVYNKYTHKNVLNDYVRICDTLLLSKEIVKN